jgi:hypothetical protein
MKTLVAVAILVAVLVPGAAFAGASTDAALGLGAFAVFNQIVAGTGIFGGFHPVPAPVVVPAPPPVVVHPVHQRVVVREYHPVYHPRVHYAPPRFYHAPAPRFVIRERWSPRFDDRHGHHGHYGHHGRVGHKRH